MSRQYPIAWRRSFDCWPDLSGSFRESWMKTKVVLYSLLVVSSILYVYRVQMWGVNISLFRILYVLWLGVFATDLLLGRIRIQRSFLIYMTVALGILLL